MKSLTQFLIESLNEAYKIDFSGVKEEYIDKYNELKHSEGIMKENELPTSIQFDSIIDKVIQEKDKEFAQSFIQLFIYEYGQLKGRMNKHLNPEEFVLLGGRLHDKKYIESLTAYLGDKKLEIEPIKFLNRTFAEYLKKYNLRSVEDIPDYLISLKRLIKAYPGIDTRIEKIN